MKTLKQFFQRLPRSGWRLTRNGDIRRETCFGLNQCPVTSVCRESISPSAYGYAATLIGMPKWMAQVIANAADCGELYAHHPDNIAELRQRMLVHMGLTGVEA